MTSFGAELHELPLVNTFTQNGIQFVGEVRDFLKERAQIEKEYGHKLDALCKRYLKSRDKTAASLMVDPPGIVDSAPLTEKFGTTFKAWESMLIETEKMAQIRTGLADTVILDVTDNLKALGARKEEARRKHLLHSQKLLDERAKVYGDKDKAKATYDQHCDAVEASKLRFEKAPDEKTQEKLKKAWHADIAEMGNAKNNYILCVHIANSLKKRYHFEDMPLLMDDMQRLNEHRMAVTKKNMEDYVNLETTAHASISKHWSQMLTHINSIEESVDCSLFIKYQKALWTEPYDFAFEPSFLWKDSDQLVVDEQAKIYLSNKLAKTADKLQMVNEQIASKHKDRDGLQNLMDAYTRNPSTGDADQVSENVIETVRQITLLEIQKDRYSTTISVISSVIGDSSSGTRHTLVKTTFTIPTTCDYCQEKIWGIASKAYTCKTCGYNCHVKCEMKVPPYCSTSGGGSSAGQRTKVNRVASGPTPTSATSGSSSMNISPLAHTSSSSVNVSASGASGSTGRVIYGYEAMNDDELTVNEGDAIRVISSDDGSGWVRVECNRKEGLVPASYVEIHSGIASSAASSIRNTTQSLQVRAIYDYDAQNADELSMREGDVIDVTQQGTDGWWFGVLKGQTGQFPSTYVEPK